MRVTFSAAVSSATIEIIFSKVFSCLPEFFSLDGFNINSPYRTDSFTCSVKLTSRDLYGVSPIQVASSLDLVSPPSAHAIILLAQSFTSSRHCRRSVLSLTGGGVFREFCGIELISRPITVNLSRLDSIPY